MGDGEGMSVEDIHARTLTNDAHKKKENRISIGNREMSCMCMMG